MPKIPVSEGIQSHFVEGKNGFKVHYLEHGSPQAPHKIMMVHGNIAAATWWEELMFALDENTYHCVAPDLRGYGESDAAPVDATRGLLDLMDDVMTVADHLGWDQFHFWGHSMGGGVAFHTIIEHGERLQKVILIAPMSPYGFGGTKDAQGTPTYPDYAGSGGGLASPDRLKMMQEGYRGADNPQAPLFLLRSVVFKPPYQIPREDALLSAFLATAVGENNLPGNSVPSANWPFVAPGDKGIQNAFSPKYYNTGNLITATHKPPILWAYGSHDAIVSNNSLSDIATLGKMGIVPGYPGEAVMPSQPMIDQIRAVLDGYKANGGDYTEHVFETVGHSPQFERFEEFLALAKAFTG